ncbi:MAG: hypothetical protein WAX69_08400 [Victivallales bacterium]
MGSNRSSVIGGGNVGFAVSAKILRTDDDQTVGRRQMTAKARGNSKTRNSVVRIQESELNLNSNWVLF